MRNLTSLQLIFKENIRDEEVMILASSFEDWGQNLEHLDLQLQWAEKTEIKGKKAKKKAKKAQKALQGLPALPALPTLPAIPGLPALLALEKGLQNLRSLRNLKLSLGKLDDQQQEAALQVLKAVRFLKNLESIEVVTPFRIQPDVSDDLLRDVGGHWNLKTFEIQREGMIWATVLSL